MQHSSSNSSPFDIRTWVATDKAGRAACPSCIQDGKAKQKNLSVDLSTGAYHCWRGCNPEQIRAALGAPPKRQSGKGFQPSSKAKSPAKRSQTSQASSQPSPEIRESIPESKHASPEICEPVSQSDSSAHQSSNASQEKQPRTVLLPQVKQSQQRLLEQPSQSQAKALEWLGGRNFTLEMIAHYRLGLEQWWFVPDENKPNIKQGFGAIALHIPTGESGKFYRKLRVAPWLVGDERPDELPKWSQYGVPATVFYTYKPEGAIATWFDGCTANGWDVSDALNAGFTWEDFQTAADEAITPTRKETGGDAEDKRPVRERISEILERYEVQSERELALMNLARATTYSCREIEKLAYTLTLEKEFEFNQVEATQKLQDLLQTCPGKLDLRRYLEPWFAESLIATAEAMPTAPEFLFTTLLAAAASRVGTAARIIIKPSGRYIQPMVFWTSVVADSGSMKTPSQRIIIDPLIDREKDAYEKHQLELAEYRTAVDARKYGGNDSEPAPKAPIRKRYLTKDATPEALEQIHAENPRGLLYYRDELAGTIKVRNQYRGGRGADEEGELDQWSGSAVIADRTGRNACLPNSSISRTGSIQWEVLSDLMGDHRDVNGAWSRWLFCAADAPPRYLNLTGEEEDTGIQDSLNFLYDELEKLPPRDYLLSLSDEAKKLFETWQHQLVLAEKRESVVGLQRACPKNEAYTARLALWLHVVNAVLRGEHPGPTISGETMAKAIELAAYFLWQCRLIHTHNAPDAGPAALGLQIQRYAERVGEVTASRLKSSIRALRKMADAQFTSPGISESQSEQPLQNPIDQNDGIDGAKNDTKPDYQSGSPPPDTLTIDVVTSPPGGTRGQPEQPEQKIRDETIQVHSTSAQNAPNAPPDESPPTSTVNFGSGGEPSSGTPQPTNQAHSLPQGHPQPGPEPVKQFQKGQLVEAFIDGCWVLAKYVRPVWHSVFSPQTEKLHDGHQVSLLKTKRHPNFFKVATPDLRWHIP